MPKVVLWQSTEGMLVIRHVGYSCFVVAKPLFRIVALDMQSWCLDSMNLMVVKQFIRNSVSGVEVVVFCVGGGWENMYVVSSPKYSNMPYR